MRGYEMQCHYSTVASDCPRAEKRLKTKGGGRFSHGPPRLRLSVSHAREPNRIILATAVSAPRGHSYLAHPERARLCLPSPLFRERTGQKREKMEKELSVDRKRNTTYFANTAYIRGLN